MPRPRQELQPVGERLEIGVRIAITRRHGWYDSTCEACGFHVCNCAAAAKLKASQEPAFIGPKPPVNSDYISLRDLEAAERRMMEIKEAEQTMKLWKSKLEVALEAEKMRTVNADQFFRQLDQMQGVAGQQGQQMLSPSPAMSNSWQIMSLPPERNALGASGDLSSAVGFAMYAANRPPLRADG